MEREKTMKMVTIKMNTKKNCFMMTQNIATSHVSSPIIIHGNNRITKPTKLRGKKTKKKKKYARK